LNFILGAFIGSWTQWSNWQITHEALVRFMDLPVWPLRSWSNKCTQNEIQSLIVTNFVIKLVCFIYLPADFLYNIIILTLNPVKTFSDPLDLNVLLAGCVGDRAERYGQQLIWYVFDTDLADIIHIRYDTHVHNLRFQNQEFCILVLKQNDHLCSVYHSFIHNFLVQLN